MQIPASRPPGDQNFFDLFVGFNIFSFFIILESTWSLSKAFISLNEKKIWIFSLFKIEAHSSLKLRYVYNLYFKLSCQFWNFLHTYSQFHFSVTWLCQVICWSKARNRFDQGSRHLGEVHIVKIPLVKTWFSWWCSNHLAKCENHLAKRIRTSWIHLALRDEIFLIVKYNLTWWILNSIREHVQN